MLLGKDGGGHQIDYLLALLHGLKCCPDGNLRLAIPYIPADQAVHNLPALHIPLSRQHIEGAALVIFNFHIILGRLLDFYLFNPTVNTHAIAFMDDIVANAQIRKALDFLSLIDFVPFLFLRLRAKNIALRNHQELDIRVFEALAQLAICHHHLPRL